MHRDAERRARLSKISDTSQAGVSLGPSHAPDDTFVLLPQHRVACGGRILEEELGALALADLVEYPRTLRQLKQLNLGYTSIIFGHYLHQYLRLPENSRRAQQRSQ